MRGFDKAARTLRKDLLTAGLPLEDADGHRIDSHSLRATFGDLLIQQGVPISTVARLMRHSDGGTLLLKRYASGNTTLHTSIPNPLEPSQQFSNSL